MHGGFENETPNIPTNTIVKLDLMQIVKGNAILTGKLESVIGPGGTAGKRDNQGNSRPGSTSPSDGSSTGSRTPPSGGAKSPTIKYDRA